MANAYSTITRQSQYIDPIDNDRVRQVLAVKQQRFDSTVDQVNQAIQTFGNVDLIRDEDREYLLNNLSKAVEIMDDEEAEFSNSGLGQELTTHLSKALDSNVLEQIANTKNIRNYEATVQQTKEKNPELYAQQNDWYATQSAGLNSYLSGETNNLGKLEYNPYYDYEKDLDKNLLTWAKQVGIDTFYEPSQVDGIKFMMEGTELKKSDVKDFIRSRMDQNAQNQIFIDNSYNFKDNTTDQLANTYKNYHSDLLDSTRNRKAMEIALLEKQGISSSPLIKNLEEKEAFHKKEMESTNLDRNSMINFIGFESYLDKKAQPYADRDYTKIAPDNTDIKRAELTYKKIKDLGSSAKGEGVRDIGGTISPIETKTPEKGELQTTARQNYENKRQEYLGMLFQNNPEFEKRYNDLNSEEEKFNAIQQEMLLNESINIGDKANPVLSRVASEFKAAASNFNLINDKYREGVEQTADRLYESMVGEIQSQNPKLSLEGLKTKYPKTVEILRKKGANISNEDRAIIRYEYAQDLQDNSAISDNANEALKGYISDQYEKVKNLEGVTDPNAKSELRKMVDNVGQGISSLVTAIGSGFDEEVLKQLEETPSEEINSSLLLDQVGEVAQNNLRLQTGISTLGLSELFQPSDTGINDFDEEDLELRDENGNAVLAKDYIKSIFEGIDKDITGELSSSERRLPQSFELILNPVTAKYNPEIRKETANFFASKTGRQIDNKERLSISINKQDRSARITQIDAKDGVVPIQVPLEQLPASLREKFETREKDWIYDASNPNAVSKNVNFTIFRDRAKAYQHLDNLKNTYQIPQVQGIPDRERARELFAPDFQDYFKNLVQRYPKADQNLINQLVLTPYEFEFFSGENDNTYNYRIFKKEGNKKEQVYENVTPMTTFNEASAVVNINTYLLKYFESVLR